ncbi:MAG: beta-ketoacyl-ACP synthase 3, partial [Micrococcales bacterium]|nr:beta-ketoacyl-ACP synthase 3 [Micrococcales bacterium]
AGTTLLDLAETASRAALDAANIAADEIDAVVMSTITHFEQSPSAAALVAERIGAAPSAAWDISAACAGYCYGIAQADALVRAGTAHHVLVVAAERLSDFVDPTDRSISFLLGDGAGAAVVTASESPGIGPTVWGSDGSRAGLVNQTHTWLQWRDDPTLGWPTLRQEGPSVYKWATTQVTGIASQAIAAAGLEPGDIEVFVPHQANKRIIDQMAKALRLDESVVVAHDIVDTGNTSAASIPLATERLYRDGLVRGGELALQIGFGAGLVWAAQVVVLP